MQLAILPWASLEEHGPLLPATCDSSIVHYLARRLRGGSADIVVLPTLNYGVPFAMPTTYGVVSRFFGLLASIVDSQAASEVNHVAILTTHEPNRRLAELFAQQLNYQVKNRWISVLNFPTPGAESVSRELLGTSDYLGGSLETSAYAAITGGAIDGSYDLADLGGKPADLAAVALFPPQVLSPNSIVTDRPTIVVDSSAGRTILDEAHADMFRTLHADADLIAHYRE